MKNFCHASLLGCFVILAVQAQTTPAVPPPAEAQPVVGNIAVNLPRLLPSLNQAAAAALPPLKENVTLTIQGILPPDHVVNVSWTGNGPRVVMDLLTPTEGKKEFLHLDATIQTTPTGFLVDYVLTGQFQTITPTTTNSVNPRVDTTVGYFKAGQTSSIYLKLNQPILLVRQAGKTLTMNLTQASP